MTASSTSSYSRHNKEGYANLCKISGLDPVKEKAKSVALIIDGSLLQKNGNRYVQATPATRLFYPYRKEPVLSGAADVTAFLVGNKLLLTYCDQDLLSHLSSRVVVFNFHMTSKKMLGSIDENMVCKIDKIVKWNWKNDLALLELADHPPGLNPIRLEFCSSIKLPPKIYILGHPRGLPLKYEERETKEGVTSGELKVKVNDSRISCEGSPVFDPATNRVIGIFRFGEHCTRISDLPEFLSFVDKDGFYKNRGKTYLDKGENAFYGKNRSQSYSEAVLCYTRAIADDPNNASAHYSLAHCHYFGQGTERNKELAKKHFKEAIRSKPDHVDARIGLVRIYLDREKYVSAWSELESCERINPSHQTALLYKGLYKLLGILHSRQDHAKAFEIFKRLANAGNSNGKLCLGICYCHGYGTPRDEKNGIKLIQEVSEIGPRICLFESLINAHANFLLGKAFYSGQNLPKEDKKLAFKYFTEAIKIQPDKRYAHQYLGFCHFYGFSVEPDIELARGHFEKAQFTTSTPLEDLMFLEDGEKRTDPETNLHLGACYFSRQYSYSEAFKNFKEAYYSKDASGRAAACLGICYLNGLGTGLDVDLGIALLHIAKKRGVSCLTIGDPISDFLWRIFGGTTSIKEIMGYQGSNYY